VTDRAEPARRAAAIGALVLVGAAIGVAVFGLEGDVGRVLATPALLLLVTATAWTAVTRTGAMRVIAEVVAGALVVLLGVVVLTAEGHGLLVVSVLGLLATSAVLVRYALRRDPTTLRVEAAPGTQVGPANRGVLIMNPKSGGGKAERFALVEECERRGIEPVVLQPGDDLLELARSAIARGADVIGMAGGDGSQALVASVAMTADVPLVCVPAGTRNRFALDLGVDRDDVVAALEAFDAAVERRIDLATVNERVFVNNVSLGVYAKIVRSPEYRDAKRQTTTKMLADLLGPGAEPFDLHFVGPDGTQQDGARIIQISNNPYRLTSLAGFGSRARLDAGELGVAAADLRGARDIAAFFLRQWTGTLQHFRGWIRWETDRLTIESGSPVEAGVDGESLLFDPPLELCSLPGALRVRIPTSAPGYSPAALRAPSPWWTLTALLRAAAGHTTPIDEEQR
jgi:diacylglycerol kinase family enzyme